MSMDIHGNYEGGGVCEECQDHTTGINCQTCEVCTILQPLFGNLNQLRRESYITEE